LRTDIVLCKEGIDDDDNLFRETLVGETVECEDESAELLGGKIVEAEFEHTFKMFPSIAF
jgi:hypothetical protein